jgi:3-oxo-5,6-didehydrosuberyl-CoA/3-oxoadipyl-CoA thiolase
LSIFPASRQCGGSGRSSRSEIPNQWGGFIIPDEKLTPNDVAVAIGHPFGATGTRYVLTLATELRERNVRYGVIGVCIGSGQGVALVLENPAR